MSFDVAKKVFNPQNNYKAGFLLKTHGNKGHLYAKLFFDIYKTKTESLFVDIDGFLVPFFIDFDNSSFDSVTSIIKFKNIDTIESAKKLRHRKIFLPKIFVTSVDEALIDFENFIVGFEVFRDNGDYLGKITDFADDKKNPLYLVENSGKELFLPLLAVEFIKTDYEKNKIIIKIPTELIDYQ